MFRFLKNSQNAPKVDTEPRNIKPKTNVLHCLTDLIACKVGHDKRKTNMSSSFNTSTESSLTQITHSNVGKLEMCHLTNKNAKTSQLHVVDHKSLDLEARLANLINLQKELNLRKRVAKRCLNTKIEPAQNSIQNNVSDEQLEKIATLVNIRQNQRLSEAKSLSSMPKDESIITALKVELNTAKPCNDPKLAHEIDHQLNSIFEKILVLSAATASATCKKIQNEIR